MDSSTSHFKSAIPSRALVLVSTALLAWIAALLYTLWLNPEMRFFRRANFIKQTWAATLDSRHQPKIVICGDSSSMTTIIPERMMEKHGLPAVNMALHADMGAKILARYAIQTLKPGDTLIVSIQPNLLAGPVKSDPEGIQFCIVTGNQALLRDTPLYDWPGTLLDLRPGGYHTLTLIGKIVSGQPLYRYRSDDIHPGGWQEVPVKRDFASFSDEKISLSNDGRGLLTWIHEFCAKQNIRVAYSMAWNYQPAESVAGFRQRNLNALQQISEFIPVLKEPDLGIRTNRDLFADTPLHLTREGAAMRTDELADQIQHWNTWTPEELKAALDTVNPTSK